MKKLFEFFLEKINQNKVIMNIILAVDIMEGKVVKAFAGFRSNYKPLFINHRDYSNPIVLIKEIIKINKLYPSIN